MNEEYVKEEILKIEINAPLVEEFLKSDVGKYILQGLDNEYERFVDQAEELTDRDTALRNYDRAAGVKAVKDMIMYPVNAKEDGTLKALKDFLSE